MASIVNRPGGHKWIQFASPAGGRRTIRLGIVTDRRAVEFKLNIEDLVVSTTLGQRPDRKTSEWLAGLSLKMRKRLAVLKLIDAPRETVTLETLVKSFLSSRNVKTSTLENIAKACENLTRYFGNTKAISSISEADAEEYLSWLSDEGGEHDTPLAQSTASRRFRRAREAFKHAIRRHWIDENPCRDISGGSEVNRARDFYVELDLINAVLGEIDNPEFRSIVTLSRFGGLRCPSEVRSLKWSAVNWDDKTLRVGSPKTERHVGGEVRTEASDA